MPTPAQDDEALPQDADEIVSARVAVARQMLERRAAETREDADARRDKLRGAMAGPGKRFQGFKHKKPRSG